MGGPCSDTPSTPDKCIAILVYCHPLLLTDLLYIERFATTVTKHGQEIFAYSPRGENTLVPYKETPPLSPSCDQERGRRRATILLAIQCTPHSTLRWYARCARCAWFACSARHSADYIIDARVHNLYSGCYIIFYTRYSISYSR